MVDVRLAGLVALLFGVTWLIKTRPDWRDPISVAVVVGGLFAAIVFGYPELIQL